MTRNLVNTPIGRTTALTLAAVLLSLTVPAAAEPFVDGRFDPGEGYTQQSTVDFAVERSDVRVTDGSLWTHVDAASGDLFVAFSQPLTLVDNTYGDNSIGWGKGVAPSGKNHNFKDLLGSDKAQFVFTDAAGNVVLDVVMDYISEAGDGAYDCLGVTGRDGEVNMGTAGWVTEWGSSLDYNFNELGHVLTKDSPLTDDDYTENPEYAGWVFEVSYEMRIAADAFGDSGFGSVAIPIVHDSPNKIGKNKVYPEITPVPEPTTLLLSLAGIPLLVARRRRRRVSP